MAGDSTEKDETIKVPDTSATCSMRARLGNLKSEVSDLEEVLTKLRDRTTTIIEHEVVHIQELKRLQVIGKSE